MTTWSNITYPRQIPLRRPEGHEPRAPRWALTYTEPVTLLTSDYLGIQVESWDSIGVQAFVERLRVSHQAPHDCAPEAWELLTCTDDAGLLNIIHLAYWRNPTHHEKWLATSALGRWYDGLDAATVAFGAWHEVIQVPVDHAETIYSDPRGQFGLAACRGTQVEPMTVNGYFGAARDRLRYLRSMPWRWPDLSGRPTPIAKPGAGVCAPNPTTTWRSSDLGSTGPKPATNSSPTTPRAWNRS